MSPCTICSPLVSATAKTCGKTLEPFPQKEPYISANRALHFRQKSLTFPICHQARVKRNYSNNFRKNHPTFLQKEPCISAKRAPHCPIPIKLEPCAITRIISGNKSPYISGKRALYFRKKSTTLPDPRSIRATRNCTLPATAGKICPRMDESHSGRPRTGRFLIFSIAW